MINIRKLESELWESADLLRAGSKLTSNQYCMPVLGLIFLRYAYSRFKLVEAEILKDRPVRGGRVLPVETSDFASKSALFLPKEAQYDYLVNLPADIASAGLTNRSGHTMNSLGEVVNNAMELVEEQSEQLTGVLPKDYTMFSDELLGELLRIFNNSALDEVGGDIIGRIYEYFLNKFAKNIAQDDGVFFTPKSLVKMIVNVLEPSGGVLLDPACGSGGMFVQTGDFVNAAGMEANSAMTFYGQEKVEYNAQLCLMNMAVHGLTGVIKSGDEANTFYHDAHNLDGCCDYIMANPPFNVDKVLFLDARNYYTVVDRTLNEWSEWQLKNLNAIVWLYRGETKKYKDLLREYFRYFHTMKEYLIGKSAKRIFSAIDGIDDFEDMKEALLDEIEAEKQDCKEKLASAPKKDRKSIQAFSDGYISILQKDLQVLNEAIWLTGKFGEGEYQDIPGLCKIATRSEIAEKNYSLTPGAYVGVAPTEDDGVDFAQRMAEIHQELLALQAESNDLMATISKNWEEVGL